MYRIAAGSSASHVLVSLQMYSSRSRAAETRVQRITRTWQRSRARGIMDVAPDVVTEADSGCHAGLCTRSTVP